MLTYDTQGHSEPCVWMSAGLVAYKLCDRDFDCERCLLDAALRGEPSAASPHLAIARPRRRGPRFPADRRYSTGHTWVQAADGDGRVLRVGLDAFAAELIGECVDIRWSASPVDLEQNDVVCELNLEVGVLPLGAPVAGRLLRGNPSLEESPDPVADAPYDDWLVELAPAPDAPEHTLIDADAAALRAQQDLGRFRRSAALQLLVEVGTIGPSLPDGGRRLTDLRQMLGSQCYLRLLRELIH